MRTDLSKESVAMNSAPSRWCRTAGFAAVAAAALIALTACNPFGGDVVAYDLPAASARYSFQAQTAGTKTVWEYTSDQPAKSDVPQSSPCIGDLTQQKSGACRPEPLIFLRYDLDLGLDNTAKAGGVHHITVTGYYQDRISTPPTVNKLRAEASFDGGKTWRPVRTKAGKQNTFAVDIDNPRRDKAPEGVGLRISATDSAGNTVEQTIPKAYQLH
ncbi:hypothetical protein GCM10010112_13580 [Actinoplanes lobatus]|uniref:Uncharacterized protein n=1 Tax=Actinoplanes lobatus TaxID=113568 RepID=A0A7W7HMG8_9ACTN|nr:hypothetical protein [Actinoplanes lobatus]MBB4753194.1 hypothetical protein [Actinoplanes lobatus]GGN59075.1 hypothetical protein GCM10010112_13580 [Actinoplanes lobatus]GIE42945.1 hypothetical protein Alo02nite_58430 [Actinoplanes lobatus]